MIQDWKTGSFEGGVHHFPIRVYYESTDFSGVVYHAEYLKFMERARTEFIRALGIEHPNLAAQDLFFAVYHMDISFKSPAQINDEIVAKTQLIFLTRVKFVLKQTLYKNSEILTDSNVSVVLINSNKKPKALPSSIYSLLETHLISPCSS